MPFSSGKLSILVISIAIGLFWLKEELAIFSIFHPSPHYQLVLGVLSSRDHFEQRQTIRNTWMLGYKQSNLTQKALVKFVVTSLDCEIPPEYRVDSYTCSDEGIWDAELAEGNALQFQQVQSSNACVVAPFGSLQRFAAVDFYVAHSIILHSLAIPSGYRENVGQSVYVELRDLVNENRLVVSTSFDLTSFTSSDFGCFWIKPVQQFLLPKGFHGTIIVHCSSESSKFNCLGSEGVMDIMKHPAIQFSPLLRYGEEADDFPFLTAPKKLSELSAPAFILFNMYEKEALKQHRAHRTFAFRSWQRRLSNVDLRLASEMEDNGDLIITGNPPSSSPLVDVYRNLPLKLLSFYSWSFQHLSYDFVGKVDDDTFVNVPAILQRLENSTIAAKYSWHGNFRRHVEVERFGKWAEMRYTGHNYPAFACGAGSVLSRDVSAWLALNAPYLRSFQGEDVSMGIWLSAVQPLLVQDDRWVCDDGCSSQMFVSAQHNSSAISRMWKNKQLRGNPCLCGKT